MKKYTQSLNKITEPEFRQILQLFALHLTASKATLQKVISGRRNSIEAISILMDGAVVEGWSAWNLYCQVSTRIM
ncbi:hypothetical protein [Neisseria weixii]|uniref:hypothetical protein n=1 Tax=Neisseria weixii TaxID=1853276 RepID=UPI0035A080B7